MRPMQILAASLAAATLLSASVPALADEGHGRGEGHKFEHHHKQNFDDLSDAAWAELNIDKAYQLGLMVGEGEGRFNPHAPIKREAAVLTAIRLMGLEAQAKTEANADLHFTDANRIDDWARGAVAVAVEKGVLPPAGDGELRPQEPASRLWVSVLLVNALGYQAEAQSKMNAPLPFRDADEIPAGLVGYVAAAVDHKLVTGYEDNTFKPNKPVTRAEMAALLGRSDGQLGDQGKRQGEVQGTVQAVDAAAGTLTLQGAHGTITANVTIDAAIYVDSKAAELSSITVGMSVWVKLDASMQITMIDARSAGSTGGGITLGQTVSGTVSAVVQPNGGILGTISIQPASGTVVTAAVAPLATITGPSGTLTLAGVNVGDQVQAQVVAGIVIQLTVSSSAATTVQGRVLSVAMVTGTNPGSISIAPDAGGASVTAAVYSTAAVTLLNADGTTTARTLADVTVGQEVKATVSGGVVSSLQIIAPATSTVQGKVMAMTAPTATAAGSLVFLANGATAATTYSIAGTVTVTQGTTARTFADLTLNTSVQLTLLAGTVTQIQILP